MKKFFLWFGITLGVILLLVLSVPVLLYVPMVQDFAVKKVLATLNENNDDLRYDIGQLRLRYPLEIELWDVCVSRPSTSDTLAYVHHVKTALEESPWFFPTKQNKERTDFVIREALVEEVRTGIDSAFVAGLDLRGSLDTLRVRDIVLNLDSSRVSVGDVWLDRPHFDVAYASTDSTIEEEPDTTRNDSWCVNIGALDVTDTHVQYDVWLVDSLNLHLSQFAMEGLNISVDTLTVDLPQSHIGVSSQMDLSYLNDSTTGWARAHLDLLLSRGDVMKIAGRGVPELKQYWPDSTDVTARLSAYLTPDELEVSPLFLKLPGLVDVEGEVKSLHPFDNRQRLADARLRAILTHANTLLPLVFGSAEKAPVHLPDSITLTLVGNERKELCQAQLQLVQDTVPCLVLQGEYNLRNDAYWTEADLSHLYASDYVDDVPVDDLCLHVEASGQALDTLHLHTNIDCSLREWGDVKDLTIDLDNSRNRLFLNIRGGDAQVDVEAGCDLNHLMAVSDRVMRELDMQTTSRIFDINALQQVIPSLDVQASMKQDNPLMPIIRQYGVSFDSLQLALTNSDSLRMRANIDTLLYEGTRVAHIGARLVPKAGNYDYLADVFYEDTITGMDFGLDVKARLLSDTISAEGELRADSMQVVTFDASLTNRIHADFYLATMPLAMVNGFLPDVVNLTGYLNGSACLDCDSIDFNALTASVWFDSASVWYEGCDLTLGLPHDSIVYRDGQLFLDQVRFLTCNDQPISIDGRVDLRKDMANPDIDLVIKSDKAQIIRNKRRKTRGQFLYGTLPITTAISVLGRPDDLKVTGNIKIPEGCNLTYFYEDDAIASQSQLNDLVEFVAFDDRPFGRDMLRLDLVPDSVSDGSKAEHHRAHKPQQNSKLDVALKISIAPSTQVQVHVPTGSEDQVTIQGGGDLKMSMDGNGKLQLSGGYNVAGGDIDFTLPMLPVTKKFALTNESWLRWSGIVDQPELNLKATEKVKCTINDATSGARVVRFLVSVLIRGTLEDMDIIFDCSAPDDAAIQSELASLTEEDRSKQALMLLIAQTYTGPSASSGSAGMSSANAAISSLVNKELESLLTGKLQHTEINVDIDSYDANGTGSQKTDYSVSVTQKFFDDRMRVTVGGKMSTGDEVQQDEASIINDVSVEWLIKKDASQYARMFRKTNYESVLEGEVVETGIGYVQKREAYKFWQLFLRSNQKRRAAREAMVRKLQEEEFLQNR